MPSLYCSFLPCFSPSFTSRESALLCISQSVAKKGKPLRVLDLSPETPIHSHCQRTLGLLTNFSVVPHATAENIYQDAYGCHLPGQVVATRCSYNLFQTFPSHHISSPRHLQLVTLVPTRSFSYLNTLCSLHPREIEMGLYLFTRILEKTPLGRDSLSENAMPTPLTHGLNGSTENSS